MTRLAPAFATDRPALVRFIAAGDGGKDIVSVPDATGLEL